MTTQGSDIILERMMSLHPKLIDLTLDRVWRLLDRLNNPQDRLPPVIHVAGTNGKGSTIAMIRAGLEGAGLKTQIYTSPHLARFHERIRLSDGLISEPALTAVLDECWDANGGKPITYFEITTCAALLAFSRDPADFCLLEVGLGGRLDSTNVIDTPALTVITPVDLDHQQFLGDTLPQIAGEKAGIIKRGCPCIIAKQHDDALEVIERQAERLAAPISAYGQHWHVDEEHGRLVFQDETGLLDLPMPALIGAHQVENAGTALAALRGLRQGNPEAAVARAEWPARLQRLRHGPLVDAAAPAELWLDGGHNPAAGQALAEALGRLPKRPLHLICGMMNTKDVAGYMRPLAAIADSLTAVSIPGEPNTLPAEDTARIAETAGFHASVAASANQALAELPKDARILICGSLYLAGAILQENG